MRVNSYNKFFTEVAKIMNTEVKSVKPIDGRYKVELANHVYLNVYRGVSGSLFIHDHRGVARITSCYDFDDFKTMKDLYERLISDYSESTNAETVTQTSEETNKTENCESTNNDMLDEKRRNYMYLYNLIKNFRKYAFEIIRKDVYFETTSNVFRNIQQLYFNNVISFTTYDYAAKHIQAVGVEKGWFDSKSEETFGYKESRRYKVTLR